MQPDPHTADRIQIGFGRVMHARSQPAVNRFDYPSYFLRIPLHAPVPSGISGFSWGRFNLLGFDPKDHGDGSGEAAGWARRVLGSRGIVADGAIWLITFPRVLGYAFKPVSFWHCHAASGELVAILAEVNNTFGERHVYLLRARTDGEPLTAEKVFHVSPFYPVRGRYSFRFDTRPGFFRVAIDYDDGETAPLKTAWWGRLQPLDARAVQRAFWAYPLMSLGIIARIHWQALKLWIKRVRFHRKPTPPLHEVTE